MAHRPGLWAGSSMQSCGIQLMERGVAAELIIMAYAAVTMTAATTHSAAKSTNPWGHPWVK